MVSIFDTEESSSSMAFSGGEERRGAVWVGDIFWCWFDVRCVYRAESWSLPLGKRVLARERRGLHQGIELVVLIVSCGSKLALLSMLNGISLLPTAA